MIASSVSNSFLLSLRTIHNNVNCAIYIEYIISSSCEFVNWFKHRVSSLASHYTLRLHLLFLFMIDQ